MCRFLYHYTVLQGYMLAKDGSMCIKTDGASGVVNSTTATGRTPAELAAATCTLMSVQDGAANGML